MTYALDLTKPKVLLGDRRRIERLDGEAARPEPVVVFEDEFAAIEAEGAGAALPDVAIDEDDPFLILFTSGTTGRPKGALLSHRSNIHFICMAMLRGAEQALRARCTRAGNRRCRPGTPCTISASPYFHVSGLNCQLVMATAAGMTIVYPPTGKWREDLHLELTEKHGATMWSLVPTQLWRLLEWPDLEQYDLSSLRTIGGGSSTWAPELLRTLEASLPSVRPGLGTGWGMTESNGAGTSLRSDSTYEHPDSIGQPATDGRARSPRSGNRRCARPKVRSARSACACPRCSSATGTIPKRPRAALDDERWYRTGDFGHVRDEFVYLEGRRQDLIIRGGENIYPGRDREPV